MARGRKQRDQAVKSQYEDFPYPPRDPEDEKKRLITGSPSHLDEVNHYLFAGKREFSKPFRALVAGGGTGDAAIMLAQQLADRGPGTVTYVDLSTASRAVVEARTKIRGLTNIEFITGSLLDLPTMGLEPFDYIDCCGVLHHLEHPEDGLKALETVLAPNGGMGLMLYATLGRIGVYHAQDALKALVGDMPPKKQLDLAKKYVDQLPKTNWLVRNPFVGDHKMGEDAAFYDLLLHPRDRSYLVPEVVELAETSDLEIAAFVEPVKYDPTVFLKEFDLIRAAKKMDYIEQATLAENLTGSLKTHIFYVHRKGEGAGIAKITPTAVPVLKDGNPHDKLAAAFKNRKKFDVTFDGERIFFDLPDRMSDIVALMDGQRTLGDIQKELKMSWSSFRGSFGPVFKLLNSWNILWLRDSG